MAINKNTGVSIFEQGVIENVTDEVWLEYTKNQIPPGPDDNCEVT